MSARLPPHLGAADYQLSKACQPEWPFLHAFTAERSRLTTWGFGASLSQPLTSLQQYPAMPHHAFRTSTSLLSSFRSSQSTLRAPLNKRFFTPSASNMVIKTFFDVSWYGPEVQVNQTGDVTSKGADKGEFAPPSA